MKTISVDEDSTRALEQFEHLVRRRRGRFERGLAGFAMLLAVGRYCRYQHLPIGHQASVQRKLMDRESRREY